jgi:CRISPR-associated endonuclease Csn1
MKIVGLDLGTNSIGWAIRDTTEQDNQIIDKGVLTFEKGVGEGKSGEFPMVQKRTESRGKRRNYQAEKYRKWELLQALISASMCPLTMDELNEWRHYKKGFGRKYPQSKRFIGWLRFDFDGDGKPDFERFGLSKHDSLYVFRMLAASDDEQVKKIFDNEQQILGRVLYQLVQRRGFRGRDEEESKTIMKGGGDSGAKGVQEIEPYIEQYGTLGSALYHLQKEKGERIRKRYNLRSHYEQELQHIAKVHGIDHDLYKHIWKAIIWQRPLRSQKGLVGICTLEKNKSRAPISHPFYEEYRTWVFINNLKIVLPASIDREAYLEEKVYPLFYNASRDFKLKRILDRLKKDGGYIDAKFKEDTKVISCMLLYEFQKLLGVDWKEKYGWNEAINNLRKTVAYSFEDIWHVLVTFDSHEKLKEFAVNKLQLHEEDAEHFAELKLQQGYATLSLSAIKKLLPYLKKGFKYSHAVYLGNMHKVIGAKIIDSEMANHLAETFGKIEGELKKERTIDEIINSLIADHQNAEQRWGMEPLYQLDADDIKDIDQKIISIMGEKSWQEKTSEKEKFAIQTAVTNAYQHYLQQRINTPLNKIFSKKDRLHDKIFKYLQDTYGLANEAIEYLWHPSEQEGYAAAPIKNGIKVLGDPQPISRGFKNPMALKTMHKLKGLMNYLLQKGKIDEDTRIVVEIARELNDTNKRKAIERWQNAREKENADYSKRIEEIAQQCNLSIDPADKEMIDKYRLWIEQNERCLYTGKTINVCDLFNGALYDFEHTVPASMSFDNELKNLSLADGKYNKQIKGKRLPTELPNYYEDTADFTAIQPRIEFMQEKVEHFKDQVDFWSKQTKFAPTKDRKDYCIQQRHINTFDLDYWRKKLDTFTIKEFKAGWRNSQLRDTQVITKYALPYLKTVFNKVDVQKGSVTSAFREIYKIQPRMEKKSRDKHSHHALDAAVLTLIPSAQIRDKILHRYNEEKDINPHNTYHEKPRDWKNFAAHYVLSMEDDMLINFQPQHRTLTATYKNVRKRGKQQFVKQKDENGKWQYRLNNEDDKIPLIAKGDTIRGQLHNDSFFAAIKQPKYIEVNSKFIPQTDGNGNFIFQKNEKRNDELFFVVKPMSALSYFTKPDDLELVVDPNLRAYLQKEIKARVDNGKTFAQAMAEPIWAFGKQVDKNGKRLNPIRNLRCKVKSGGGGYVSNPATVRNFEAFKSKKEYKQYVYALNGETAICAFYQGIVEGESIRVIEPCAILTIAKSHASEVENAVNANKEISIQKTKHLIPLYSVLRINQKVLFYKDEMDELKNLSTTELGKRLYRITKFEDGRISFKHHLNSMSEDNLKKEMKRNGLPDVGISTIDFSSVAPKLRLSKNAFNFAIEEKHFEVLPDGSIKWQI